MQDSLTRQKTRPHETDGARSGADRRKPATVRLSFTALAILLAVLFGVQQTAIAQICFESSYGAIHQRAGLQYAEVSALRGNQNIRVTPGIQSNPPMSQVHIAQMAGSGVDFVAIGTYRGRGPAACVDDYDATWDVYVDGRQAGVYFCQTVVADAHTAGANPSFEIRRTTCVGSTKWTLFWEGIVRSCPNSSLGSQRFATVGLETTGTPNAHNIDVRHNALQVQVNSAWVDFGAGAQDGECHDPAYSTQEPSDTNFREFLPPWD